MTGLDLRSAGYDQDRARLFRGRAPGARPGASRSRVGRTREIRPFSLRTYSSAAVGVDGYQPGPDEQPTVEYNEVSPAYLATLGIPLVAGREFTPDDGESAAPVAIVNDLMAARYWRGKDPIGRRLQMNGKWTTVVGVARIARYRSLLESPEPFFYVPLRQNPATTANLKIRTSRDAAALAPALLREIRALHPTGARPAHHVREQVERSATPQRVAVILGAFGGSR